MHPVVDTWVVRKKGRTWIVLRISSPSSTVFCVLRYTSRVVRHSITTDEAMVMLWTLDGALSALVRTMNSWIRSWNCDSVGASAKAHLLARSFQFFPGLNTPIVLTVSRKKGENGMNGRFWQKIALMIDIGCIPRKTMNPARPGRKMKPRDTYP